MFLTFLFRKWCKFKFYFTQNEKSRSNLGWEKPDKSAFESGIYKKIGGLHHQDSIPELKTPLSTKIGAYQDYGLPVWRKLNK